MDRRKFLKNSSLTLTGLAASKLLMGQESIFGLNPELKGRRPNILFIMTDQQFAGAMSNTGNKDLKTPAMDYIASNGIRFEKGYCPTPLCVPSRSSMFTGMYPHEINVPINNMEAKWDTQQYPYMGKILSEAGYDTGYVGKWHLPADPKDIETHGFDYIKYAKDNRIDSLIDGASRDFLMKKREKPFLLVSSFVNPHDICQWARGDEMLNDHLGEPPAPGFCPELPANFELPDLEPDILRTLQTYSQRTYPTKDWNEDKWRQYRWAYYRLIEIVDARIQKVLDALKESGEEENTIIIFTSDHGDGHGAHKWNQKQVLYEESARVPLLVSWKGVTQPGSVNSKEVVSTGIDLIPTLCDIAGVKAPAHMKGSSFKNLALGKEDKSWREFTVIETEFCQSKNTFDIKGRCVRTENFKYMVYDKGELHEQLFDMEKDPGEMNNLAYKKEYRKVLRQHRKYLEKWMKETIDNFRLPY
jgi:choline-sulfatase